MLPATQSAVDGSSCMTPMAPAEETTPACQPDSCQATARANATGTPWRCASAPIMRAIALPLRDEGRHGGGHGPGGRSRCPAPDVAFAAAPGMLSTCPARMYEASAMPLARAMAVTVVR